MSHHYLRRSIAILLALACPAIAADVPKPGTHEETLEHGKVTRKYQLHVPPAYDGSTAMPLVFALHGRGGNGKGFLNRSGWVAKSDQEKFLVVAPDATGEPSAWNSGYNSGRAYPVDDVAFFRALLDQLEKDLKVDPKRVYVAGHSSGAMMSYRLGAEMSDRIAAIGPVSGSIGARFGAGGGKLVTIAEPKNPVSVITIHGKADATVPYDGKANRGLSFVPLAESVAFWVKHDACDPKPKSTTSADGNLITDVYRSDKDGTEVVLYTIVDGSHAWPRLAAKRPIDATDVIWDFFARHPKP